MTSVLPSLLLATLIAPVHVSQGSTQYDATGAVVAGPPPRGLVPVEAKIDPDSGAVMVRL